MDLLAQLVTKIIQTRGSDIHIGVGSKPVLRIDGALKTQEELPVLLVQDLDEIAKVILSDEQRKLLDKQKELDIAYEFENKARFRVNAYFEKKGLNFALRYISEAVPTAEELGLPEAIIKLVEKPYGLFLITGPTGSGKSTTLAALIDHINSTRAEHIITIEDPIEYLHKNKKSSIKQREVPANTRSFPNALRSALREDPDVILIGELRDLETTRLAITAAETGHLVLSTLHTNNAYQAISRIIDIFPAQQQGQIRSQLATTLIGVAAQRLVPKIQGSRIAAFEIMICNEAVKSLISQNKIQGLTNTIKTSRQQGMILLEDYLQDLVLQGTIESEDAKLYLESQAPVV